MTTAIAIISVAAILVGGSVVLPVLYDNSGGSSIVPPSYGDEVVPPVPYHGSIAVSGSPTSDRDSVVRLELAGGTITAVGVPTYDGDYVVLQDFNENPIPALVWPTSNVDRARVIAPSTASIVPKPNGDRVQFYYPEGCYGDFGFFESPDCLYGWTEVEVNRNDREYRLRSASGILLIAACTVLLVTGTVGVRGAGSALLGCKKGRRA